MLALVAANPGTSQVALARRAGINTSALVGIIDQLEKLGLIARAAAPADRRRNAVRVTSQGEVAMNALFAAVSPGEGPIRDALGPDDLAQLLTLLDRATEALG